MQQFPSPGLAKPEPALQDRKPMSASAVPLSALADVPLPDPDLPMALFKQELYVKAERGHASPANGIDCARVPHGIASTSQQQQEQLPGQPVPDVAAPSAVQPPIGTSLHSAMWSSRSIISVLVNWKMATKHDQFLYHIVLKMVTPQPVFVSIVSCCVVTCSQHRLHFPTA